MKPKLAFIDLETTGLFPNKHGIIQIGCILEEEEGAGILDEFSIKMKPFEQDDINPKALEVNQITREEIEGPDYMSPEAGYRELTRRLGLHVDKYNKQDKFHFVGYNSQHFDDPFLRNFFKKNNDKYYNSWFFTPTLDVMILAAYKARTARPELPGFKLSNVAKLFEIEVDPERLHEALYDVSLTRAIYHKLHS